MEKLCKEFKLAKAAEIAAKAHRLQIEQAIIDKMSNLPSEGTRRINLPSFSLTITARCKRKLDYDAYQALQLPDNISFVDLKPTINLKKLRAVEMIDPDLVAKCVTVYPAKTSVKLAALKED